MKKQTKITASAIVIGSILGLIIGTFIFKNTQDYRIYKFKMSSIDWVQHKISGNELNNLGIELAGRADDPQKCQIDIMAMAMTINQNPDENPYEYIEIVGKRLDEDCK